MIRILLVDDQNLVQQGIKSLLAQDPELKIIGTVKDGRSAVEQTEVLHPDVVLIDIEMPGMDGITATKYINCLAPKTKVIVLTSHDEKKYVIQALKSGAKGYLLKSSLIADLKQAIVAVNNGYFQVESKLLNKIFTSNKIGSQVNKYSLNQPSKARKSQIKNQQANIPSRELSLSRNEYLSAVKKTNITPTSKLTISKRNIPFENNKNPILKK